MSAAAYDLSAEEAKAVYDFMEREHPEMWHICYPRIYEGPSSTLYYSPKEPARQLFAIGLKIREGMVGASEKYEFCAASQLIRYRVPMFWLGADMALAIRKTVPPQQIEWYDMPLPFEAAVFMLPKGSLVHQTEGDVSFVAYARLKAGQRITTPLVPGMPVGSTNGGMVFLALTRGGHLIHWNLPLDAYGPTISLPDIDELVQRYKENEHDSGFTLTGLPLTMTPEDHQMVAEVVHYVFGSILVMENRPDLVTKGGLIKRVSKKGKQPREFWSPNMLGEHYKIRRETESQGGTHASPRFHWVRGAYKQQPFGVGRELRKTIWVEPYTRGG
jgi:hypothetical protein